MSKITVTVAGVTVLVPAPVAAGLTASGATAGRSSSLLDMGLGLVITAIWPLAGRIAHDHRLGEWALR